MRILFLRCRRTRLGLQLPLACRARPLYCALSPDRACRVLWFYALAKHVAVPTHLWVELWVDMGVREIWTEGRVLSSVSGPARFLVRRYNVGHVGHGRGLLADRIEIVAVSERLVPRPTSPLLTKPTLLFVLDTRMEDRQVCSLSSLELRAKIQPLKHCVEVP